MADPSTPDMKGNSDRPVSTMHLTRPKITDDDDSTDDHELSNAAEGFLRAQQAEEEAIFKSVLRQDGFSDQDYLKPAKIGLDGHGRLSPTAFYARTGNLPMLKMLGEKGALQSGKMGSMGRSPMLQAVSECVRADFVGLRCTLLSHLFSLLLQRRSWVGTRIARDSSLKLVPSIIWRTRCRCRRMHPKSVPSGH